MSKLENYYPPRKVSPDPGNKIGQYEIISQLGEGTFGVVFKVKNPEGKIFALKLLRLYDLFPVTERENVARRFELEFQTAQINSRYLVPAFEKGIEMGNPYFIMHYCPKGSLRDKVGEHLPESLVRNMAIQSLRGLKALHENGKIHRDLKPDNILLDENEIARLTDFGITGHMNLFNQRDVRLTTTDIFGKPKERFGSYPYMPPEQIKPPNRVVTKIPANDVFSFGATFYEILTGNLPFGPITSDAELSQYIQKLNKGNHTPIRYYRNDIGEIWETIMQGCLQPDYRKRFNNVDQILQLLGQEVQVRANTDLNTNVCLKILQGEMPGTIYHISNMLKNKIVGKLTIGRDDYGYQNDLPVKDDLSCYISRFHATIELHERNQWIVRDGQWRNTTGQSSWLRSTNGTFVNGVEVDHKGHHLQLNDIITIGETTIKFQEL